jgi:hypothetical protein
VSYRATWMQHHTSMIQHAAQHGCGHNSTPCSRTACYCCKAPVCPATSMDGGNMDSIEYFQTKR